MTRPKRLASSPNPLQCVFVFPSAVSPAPRSKRRSVVLPAAQPRRIVKHKDIAGERELALITKAQRGDDMAARSLLEAHAPIIQRWAKRTAGWSGVDEEDLKQEAEMGFMVGVKRFDPSRGVKLMSMATWWIRHAVEHYAQETMRLIRLPTAQQAALVAEAKRGETRQGGRKHRAAASAVFSGGFLSLDAPVGTTNPSPLVELLASTGAAPDTIVSEAREQACRQSLLTEALATLSERELAILTRRVVDDDPPTLETLGAEFGISRERVRQVEAEALGRLREFLADYATDDDTELCEEFTNGDVDFERLRDPKQKRAAGANPIRRFSSTKQSKHWRPLVETTI